MKNSFFNFTPESNPYFIADIAANHDGTIERAKELIWLAKEAGADCAKFQHFIPDNIVNDLEFNKLEGLETHQLSWKSSVSKVYDDYHFKREWTDEIVSECVKADIHFSSTPYDLDAINMIKDHVPFIKIGSGDISWIQHIQECINTGLPIAIATGASTLDDVRRAMALFETAKNEVCLMQCNTNYTVDSKKVGYVNLNVLRQYQIDYPDAILGLSDHTMTDSIVLGAVSLGVKVIEKHFTDDNTRVGPDHAFAINPKNWRDMVDKSQEIILAMGDGLKRVEDNERNAYVVQRRSCTVNKDLPKGHVLTLSDLKFLRPCPDGSVQPFDASSVIGKRINLDLSENSSLLHAYIE
jgi:sialic acid synthase SpsE